LLNILRRHYLRPIIKSLDNSEYVATVPGLQGVWATGKTIEGARTELVEVIEGWIALRLRLGLPIPSMDNQAIEASAEPITSV